MGVIIEIIFKYKETLKGSTQDNQKGKMFKNILTDKKQILSNISYILLGKKIKISKKLIVLISIFFFSWENVKIKGLKFGREGYIC